MKIRIRRLAFEILDIPLLPAAADSFELRQGPADRVDEEAVARLELKMKPEDSATLAVNQLGAPCGRHQFQQPRKFLAHERLDMPHERWVNCVGHVHAVPLRSLSAGVGQRQALNPSEVA